MAYFSLENPFSEESKIDSNATLFSPRFSKMTDITSTPELPKPPIAPGPVDLGYYAPTSEDLAFWKETLRVDDEVAVKERLHQVALQAYEKYPYPCIRMFTFVNLICANHFSYTSVLKGGKSGDHLYLDLGCFFGIDVRKLVLDGYPASNIYGADLRSDYISIGSSLFDSTFPPGKEITYLKGDIFSPSFLDLSSSAASGSTDTLTPFKGRFTYIFVGALFHLFNSATQRALAVRLAKLWTQAPGAIIYGRHGGRLNGEEGIIDDPLGRDRYAHSPSSWMALWKDIVPQAIVKAEVEDTVTWAGKFDRSNKARNLFWEVRTP
ncbi:hypothetical protein BT69DRAFT_1302984 [Atractiella rhizophila]|nr:hypothetical protein BT69DRAFT_1302984 [Atractiella rhizophila]